MKLSEMIEQGSQNHPASPNKFFETKDGVITASCPLGDVGEQVYGMDYLRKECAGLLAGGKSGELVLKLLKDFPLLSKPVHSQRFCNCPVDEVWAVWGYIEHLLDDHAYSKVRIAAIVSQLEEEYEVQSPKSMELSPLYPPRLVPVV